MAQLDFRQAFTSTDEPVIAVARHETVVDEHFDQAPLRIADKFRALGRSDWTNISFVTAAVLGGLVCAFYFFNGGDLLRAAAAWPREFLYPRPMVAASVNNNPSASPVAGDQTADDGSAPDKSKRRDKSGPFGNVFWPDSLSERSALGTLGSTPAAPGSSGPSFPVPPSSGPPPPSVLPPPPVGSTLLNDLNTLIRGADSLFQTLYQTVLPRTPVPRLARRSLTAAQRKALATAKAGVGLTSKSLVNSTKQTARKAIKPWGFHQSMAAAGVENLDGSQYVRSTTSELGNGVANATSGMSNSVANGVASGISNGVTSGVANGVSGISNAAGGISSGVSGLPSGVSGLTRGVTGSLTGQLGGLTRGVGLGGLRGDARGR
jgi:hypothetical protein